MIIFAHRGASGYEPENTLASFKKALDLGADGIELDVFLLPSGEVVCIHDRKVDRTTNGSGFVANFGFGELRKLDAGHGQQIPTLQEVIELVARRIPINIELKGYGSIGKAVADIIQEYLDRGWSSNDFAVSSYNHVALAEFITRMPAVHSGATTCIIPIDGAAYGEALHAHSVHLYMECIDKALVDDAHARGLEVYAYEVNDELDAKEAQSLGVDGIFSDYPDKVRAYLER